MKERVVICPGSFDPITIGHLDIISRASAMFDKVIVLIVNNTTKHCCFTPDERKQLIEKSVVNLPNVNVDVYDGLLADYAADKKAFAIIKGLRAMSDFEYEFQMALTNKKLNPNIETLFLITSTENMYLSSSMVKQVAYMGGSIKDFVPAPIHDDIVKRLTKK